MVAAAGLHVYQNPLNLKESKIFEEQITTFRDNIDEVVITGIGAISESSSISHSHLPRDLRFTYITKESREMLIESISGLTFPLFPPALFYSGNVPLIHEALSIISRKVQLRATGIFEDYPPLFRCSTGGFALALAVSRHGQNCSYRLCGIGASDRREKIAEIRKSDSDKISANLSSTNALTPELSRSIIYGLEPHVYSDVKLIRVLSKIYHIEVTDQELSSVLNSSCWEFN